MSAKASDAESLAPEPAPSSRRPSPAARAGRFVQAIVLAVAVAAVVLKLLRDDLDLTFRYGGF